MVLTNVIQYLLEKWYVFWGILFAAMLMSVFLSIHFSLIGIFSLIHFRTSRKMKKYAMILCGWKYSRIPEEYRSNRPNEMYFYKSNQNTFCIYPLRLYEAYIVEIIKYQNQSSWINNIIKKWINIVEREFQINL